MPPLTRLQRILLTQVLQAGRPVLASSLHMSVSRKREAAAQLISLGLLKTSTHTGKGGGYYYLLTAAGQHALTASAADQAR